MLLKTVGPTFTCIFSLKTVAYAIRQVINITSVVKFTSRKIQTIVTKTKQKVVINYFARRCFGATLKLRFMLKLVGHFHTKGRILVHNLSIGIAA